MRDSKGTTLDVFNLLFHSVHYWLELDVSIQQHQGFSRHRNEAAQALQREFHWQDDVISMMLSKQSESTKVGLSAHDERAREKLRRRSRKAGHSFKSAWLISNIFRVWSPQLALKWN